VPTTEVNGQPIAYYDSGGPDPTVVLCHGFLMDHEMFDEQVEQLGGKLRVITWDQRGFGGSPALKPFTFWDSATDLLGLLDHLEVDTAVVGGLSQGGFVALRATLLAPTRVRGLVLIATQSGLEDPADSAPLIQAWRQAQPPEVAALLARNLLGPGEWPEWVEKWSQLPADQLGLAYRCLIERDDITDRLGEIMCPAIVVHGTADTAIPFEKSEILTRGLAGPTELIAVDDAPHALSITNPQAVNHAIVKLSDALAHE
jgi:3-oxoadipate enol-lactonase